MQPSTPDLQTLINQPGWGRAHKALCEMGHPTEIPRSAEIIDYRIRLRGPVGDVVDMELPASSVTEAIWRAREQAYWNGPLEIQHGIFDPDDITIVHVICHD